MHYFTFCSVAFFFKYSDGLHCLDENNNPMDWIMAYKLPAINHENTLIQQGLFYMYMTSKNDSQWISSDIPINSSNSLIANIISNLYQHQKHDLFILYNDESPNGMKTSEKGHNKGLVLVNNEGGLWFIHSVPKFPSPDHYHFPETGMKFGQSFLCISLNLENMDKVGFQLQYNEPFIYSQNIPQHLKTIVPNLVAAAGNITVSKSPWYHQSELFSQMGTVFISFAKSKKFGKDIYVDWVAPTLQSNLLVETWPDGPGRLVSDCTKLFKVKNIQSIFLPNWNFDFNTTHDHSKWAVSTPGQNFYWICIGDINRALHQEKRGGGTVCFKNKKVSNQYQKLVKHIEECK